MRDFFEQYLNNEGVLKRFRGIGALFEDQTFTSLEVKVSGELDTGDIPEVYEHPSGRYEVRFVSVDNEGGQGDDRARRTEREMPRANVAGDILDELEEDEAGQTYVPAETAEEEEETDAGADDVGNDEIEYVDPKREEVDADDEIDEFDPMGENAMPKLERIIVSQSRESNVPVRKVVDLKRYAAELWKYVVGVGINPVFMSVQPDNYRIVIKVEDGGNRDILYNYLKNDKANFCARPSNVGEIDEIYSTQAGRKDYEVRIGINEKATLA